MNEDWHEVASDTIDLAADRCLDRTYSLERQAIAAGWLDPVALHDGAHSQGVCGRMFGDALCRFLFAYLVTVADLTREPDPDEAAALADDAGLWNEPGDDLICTNATDILDVVVFGADGLNTDCESLLCGVKELHQRREDAKHHYKAYVGAISGTGDEYDVVLRKRFQGALQTVKEQAGADSSLVHHIPRHLAGRRHRGRA